MRIARVDCQAARCHVSPAIRGAGQLRAGRAAALDDSRRSRRRLRLRVADLDESERRAGSPADARRILDALQPGSNGPVGWPKCMRRAGGDDNIVGVSPARFGPCARRIVSLTAPSTTRTFAVRNIPRIGPTNSAGDSVAVRPDTAAAESKVLLASMMVMSTGDAAARGPLKPAKTGANDQDARPDSPQRCVRCPCRSVHVIKINSTGRFHAYRAPAGARDDVGARSGRALSRS